MLSSLVDTIALLQGLFHVEDRQYEWEFGLSSYLSFLMLSGVLYREFVLMSYFLMPYFFLSANVFSSHDNRAKLLYL